MTRNPSDAEDLYGKSKYLGEVTAGNALTLRTSIIGRELAVTALRSIAYSRGTSIPASPMCKV